MIKAGSFVVHHLCSDKFPGNDFEGGIILKALNPETVPALFEVLWCNGKIQKRFEDELRLVSHD